MTIFEYNDDRENEQQKRLYTFAVGMGGKYFVEIAGCDMEDNSYKNVSVGFVIKPVHQNNKREDTDNKVQTVNPSFLHHVGMIIAFDACKWEVPNSPIGSKKHGGIKEIHASTQAVGAIAVPCQFFKYRGKDEEKPYGEDARCERVVSGNDEL